MSVSINYSCFLWYFSYLAVWFCWKCLYLCTVGLCDSYMRGNCAETHWYNDINLHFTNFFRSQNLTATYCFTYFIKTDMIKTALKACTASLALLPIAAAPVAMQAQNIVTESQMEKFSTYPTYDGEDLELSIDRQGYHFCLWSPMADSVRVNIYKHGQGNNLVTTFLLDNDAATGTWRATSTDDWMNHFYTFQIKIDGKWLDETPGVWAKAVGVNGRRAAIIDFSKTNPEGWGNDSGPQVQSTTDVILYEMHHRDFSMHKNSGITNKGKFVAMLEEGTVSLNGQSTGIDHLKELGITHVHILPSFDYMSVDETQLPSNIYNWGYDPINYNVPDGSYSTNPADPYCRIREMKQMIKALHDAGIGVVMDVVYNHTGITEGSNFELTAPGYYYRQRTDGTYSDASACGNETASDRQQMRNFIINSVKYWVKEYHIDGFRFDLMAIHDIETMSQAAAAIKTINPSAFIYGEGWMAGSSPLPVEQQALKVNVAKMKDIAVFSDDIRDAVKGHYSDEADRGFVSGKLGNEETVKIGIVASTAHPQVDYSKGNNAKFPYATSPQQIINYVSCHDDLCLTDKLDISMAGSTEEDRISAAKLAQTIIFTSQGTPFMFAGEEVFRSKQHVHNSFCSPDSINAIDWNQKVQYRDLFDYYRNLIAMRKAHPAFRLTTAEAIAKHIKFDDVKADNLVSYSITDNAGGDTWKEIKLVFNGANEFQTVKIKKGKWTIVAQDGKIDMNGLGTCKGGEVSVAPHTALILVTE